MMNEFQVYTEQSELKDSSSSSFVLTGCLGRCHGKEVWPHYFQVKVETPLPQLASTDTPEQEGVLYHHWAGTEFRVHTRPPRISGPHVASSDTITPCPPRSVGRGVPRDSKEKAEVQVSHLVFVDGCLAGIGCYYLSFLA